MAQRKQAVKEAEWQKDNTSETSAVENVEKQNGTSPKSAKAKRKSESKVKEAKPVKMVEITKEQLKEYKEAMDYQPGYQRVVKLGVLMIENETITLQVDYRTKDSGPESNQEHDETLYIYVDVSDAKFLSKLLLNQWRNSDWLLENTKFINGYIAATMERDANIMNHIVEILCFRYSYGN